MSLPTAQTYVIQNLIQNLVSLEKNFLKPNVLLKLLNKTELAMAEIAEIFSKEELAQELLEKEKENIKLIIEKLNRLEKTSHEKLNWANQFSNYLQNSINTK
tara:strand:+ start:349 stop:654 length:306 start_codon:yes stop_codon:yes gene_type:complete